LATDQLVIDTDVPVLDQSRLLEEFGDAPEILMELRDLFIQHLPPLLNDIRSAFEAGDCDALSKNAHSLKGAASTYGAQRLFMICKSIEHLARDGELEATRELVSMLTGELDQLTAAVNDLTNA